MNQTEALTYVNKQLEQNNTLTPARITTLANILLGVSTDELPPTELPSLSVRKTTSPLAPTYEILEIEYILATATSATSGRSGPISFDILNNIDKKRIPILNNIAAKATPAQIAAYKKLLAQLRQDNYAENAPQYIGTSFSKDDYVADTFRLNFGTDIPILYGALGSPSDWPSPINPCGRVLTEDDIDSGALHFNFNNVDHLHALIQNYHSLFDPRPAASIEDVESTTADFQQIFLTYLRLTALKPDQLSILRGRIDGLTSQEIKEQYSLTYAVTYISTIYRNTILPSLALTAYLYTAAGNAPEEAFKQCTSCGRYYLRDPYFFHRRARSSDGYAYKCKKCAAL